MLKRKMHQQEFQEVEVEVEVVWLITQSYEYYIFL